MNTQTILPLVRGLSECESEKEIRAACKEFCEVSGFEYFAFCVCSASSLSNPQLVTIHNYPKVFCETYFEGRCYKGDPLIKYCFEETLPVTWRTLSKIPEYSGSYCSRFLKGESGGGLTDGIFVPLKSPSGEVAAFSLATSNDADLEERLLSATPFVHYVGFLIFEAYLRVTTKSERKESLTPREKESLFWACEGKTAWEMSKIMSISERTAIFHLSSVTKKLGAANRQHAVAKAVLLGLVKPQPQPQP